MLTYIYIVAFFGKYFKAFVGKYFCFLNCYRARQRLVENFNSQSYTLFMLTFVDR